MHVLSGIAMPRKTSFWRLRSVYLTLGAGTRVDAIWRDNHPWGSKET